MNSVVRLGASRVFCATSDERLLLTVFPVPAIDTVAAGDAFNGGLAAALAEGQSLREAIVWGAATGALAATKAGAQSSLPDRAAVEALLKTGDR